MEKKIEKKPTMFVGSSVESLDIAYAIQENLEHTVDVTVWDQGVFIPSHYNLESIIDAAQDFDFGAFIFSPDDIIVIREQEKMAVRDNVIFELGVFIGRLGKSKCFIIKPREEKDLDLPSDLLGLVPLTYSTTRDDDNLKAALGPACNQIRKVIEISGSNPSSDIEETPLQSDSPNNEQDSRVMLTAWLKQSINNINNVALNYNKLDEELSLFPGTSKNHLKQIAEAMNLKVVEESENMVIFKRGPTRAQTLGTGRDWGQW
jgi:hypothetical protein